MLNRVIIFLLLVSLFSPAIQGAAYADDSTGSEREAQDLYNVASSDYSVNEAVIFKAIYKQNDAMISLLHDIKALLEKSLQKDQQQSG